MDTGDPDYAELVAKYGSHSGLMTAHALFMTLSFLIFLPLGEGLTLANCDQQH